jgi:large exoprotein involved in heme utilization and adhesion
MGAPQLLKTVGCRAYARSAADINMDCSFGNKVQLDPTVTQKRLGDGYYEQSLVRAQVAQLTGRRFLGDFTSDDHEYRALMDAGVSFAKTYNLRGDRVSATKRTPTLQCGV